jgi:hypothetical protein
MDTCVPCEKSKNKQTAKFKNYVNCLYMACNKHLNYDIFTLLLQHIGPLKYVLYHDNHSTYSNSLGGLMSLAEGPLWKYQLEGTNFQQKAQKKHKKKFW